MDENQKALEELRKIFSDYLDLEQELYQKFEKKIEQGVILKYSFLPAANVDFLKFFKTCPLWKIIKGSTHFIDEGDFSFRGNLTKPCFLGKDFFNIELTVGEYKQSFSNESIKNIPDFYTLRDLSHQIQFAQEVQEKSEGKIIKQTPEFLARELKKHRHFFIKFTRTKKDASNFRLALENDSYINETDKYKQKIDKKFKDRIKEIVQDSTSLSGEILRLHLQKRLIMWGFQFKGLLEPKDLITQYENIFLFQVFPSLIDASLFINFITFNDNEEVLRQIQEDPYKNQVLKQLNALDLNLPIELTFSGVNMDSTPEFKIL